MNKLIVLGLGACLCLLASESPTVAPPDRYLSVVISALQKEWPDNRTINIVFHGHSVPAGYFATPEVHSLEAYPHLVRQALARAFPHAVVNVIVSARGGENSVEGAARFERDVLAHQPDVVLIDYSLNDRNVRLESARAAWAKMILAARQHGAAVILLTPSPDLTAKLGVPGDALEQHAEQVRRLAAEYGIGLVDTLRAFRAAAERRPIAELMAQSNHPNGEGHKLIANGILLYFHAAPR